MKAYEVQIRNKEETWRTGAVDQTLLILADDIMTALMYAEEKLSELVASISEAGITNIENIRITSIAERYFAVTGNLGLNYTKDSIKSHDEWLQDMVSTLKKRQGES